MKTGIFCRKTITVFLFTFLFFILGSTILSTYSIAAETTVTSSADKKIIGEPPESTVTSTTTDSTAASPTDVTSSESAGTSTTDAAPAKSAETSPTEEKTTESTVTSSTDKKPTETNEAQTQSLPPVKLTKAAIQKRIDDVNAMSELSAESKKKIIGYYEKALKSLERRQNAVQQTAKYSNLIKRDESKPETGNDMLMVRPIAIEQKARSMALTDIESKVAELQAQLGLEQTNLEVAKQLQDDSIQKPAELRKNIASYEAELAKLQSQLDNPKKNDSLTPREIRARRTSTRAKCAALKAELKAAEQASGLTKYNAGQINDKLAAMARKVNQLEKLIKTWGDIKETRQTDIGFNELRQNKASLKQLNKSTYPDVNIEPLQKLAKRNIEIAQEIITVGRSDNESDKSLDILKARQTQLTEDFGITQRRVNMMGLTKKSGEILQAKRIVLLSSRAYPEIVKKRSTDILNANLKSDDLLQESQKFLPYKDNIYQALDKLDGKIPENQLNTLSTKAFVLLESYRKLLADSGKCYVAYIKTLNSQTAAQKKIDSISQEFRDYINQRLLWTSSSNIYSRHDITGSSKAVHWLLNSSNWKSLIKDFYTSCTRDSIIWVLIFLAFIVSVIFQFFLPKQIAKINIYPSKPKLDTTGRTIAVVTLGILQPVCIPLVIYLGALFFSEMANIHIFSKAISLGIFKAAGMSIIFFLVLYFCKKEGIGITNFKWSEKVCGLARKNVRLFLCIAMPLVFLIVALQNGPLNLGFRGSLGRTLAVILLVIILLFILKILKNSKKAKIDTRFAIWIRKYYLWAKVISITILLALIILAIAGYYFTVYEFTINLSQSFYYLIVFLLLKEILHRIIYLSQIHIAYKKAEAEKKAERERKKLEKLQHGTDTEDNLDIEIIDIVIDEKELSTQTFQLINFILFIGIIAGIVWIWSNTFPSIQFLNNIAIWSSATTIIKDGVPVIRQITILNLLQAIFILACTVVLVKNLAAIIELLFFRGKQAHPGSRHAFTLISKYIVSCIGFFLGLKFIGIGWAQFQYMAAAMTVGLSFGLKDIFANFVSGIIILLERPIRMGDVISVGDASGTVTRIQIRSTTITQWDRHELIVPNQCFLSEKIVNWSLSNDIMRVVISVKISYGSDAKKAEKILKQIAINCPLTLETPAPSVMFVDFTTNSYDFAVRVFVLVDDMMIAPHKIRHEILDQFKKEGIKIPYAEQNIHFSTEEHPLKVEVMNDTKK